MKTIFIECKMGAAGDMLMSALSELHPDPEGFVVRFNALGIKDVRIERHKEKKCGIEGTHIRVFCGETEEDEDMHEHSHEHGHEHSHEHGHRHLSDVEGIIRSLPAAKKVCENAIGVYRLLAAAEAKVHGSDIENIHFHEVGTMDAIADIVGVCMLIDELGADRITASPVNVGGGFVKCAHGILPVPAPATAELLRGIPMYSNTDEGELCTPTGAALLKYFVSEFCDMPLMSVEKTGCGLGTKNFKRANILRVFIGETGGNTDEIFELSCNIDDMTGEEIAFASEMIFKAGARDVFTSPIYMKKSRPALLLSCICTADKRDDVVRAVFRHTSTIGIREYKCGRYILDREEKQEDTKYGKLRIKAVSGYGVKREKPEFEDAAKAAEENNVPLFEIKNEIIRKRS